MKIRKFIFNAFGENTYIVWNEETRRAAIIDPGMNDEYERNVVKEFVERNALSLCQLINTHMHFDHAAGNHFIETTYGIPTSCNMEDCYLSEVLARQAQMFGQPYRDGDIKIKVNLEEGPTTVADEPCQILHIPGHTKGHIALYFPKADVVFSGDALFQLSIGRTDLPGGDYATLINSIETKLLSLPENTKVLPGHGPETTIGFEKENNPFF